MTQRSIQHSVFALVFAIAMIGAQGLVASTQICLILRKHEVAHFLLKQTQLFLFFYIGN